MGNQGKNKEIYGFFKNKKFLKLSILFSFIFFIYFYFLISENFNSLRIKNSQNKFLTANFEDFYNFFSLKKIILVGRSKENIEGINQIVEKSIDKETDLINLKTKKTKDLIKSLPWVKTVSIKKNYPNILIIKISEHEPFAILKEQRTNFLISDEGKIIYEIKSPEAYKMVELEGRDVTEKIEDIKLFFNNNHLLKKEISKIYIHNNGRWDLTLNNKVLFKLPKENMQNAVNAISKYASLENIKMVDLRFIKKNKVYIKSKKDNYAMKKNKKK